MHVTFRIDASETIGTGHLFRCLTLANALAASGANCSFLSIARGLGALRDVISEAGHSLQLLQPSPGRICDVREPPHAKWLPHGWRADAAAAVGAISAAERPDWMVVDHYALDARWELALSSHVERMLVIDDLADRQHAATLLLDQNPLPDPHARYANLVPAQCQLLLGPRFALLRPEFAQLRKASLARQRPRQPRHLFVMMGGADRLDITGAVVDALADLSFLGSIDVVAGPLYPHLTALRTRLARLSRANLLVAPRELARSMSQADLAIGSPGVATYERCALGLPTLALSSADNQEPLGAELHRLGVHEYLGRFEALAPLALGSALRSAIDGQLDLARQSRMASALCDGHGAERVCAILFGSALPGDTAGAFGVERC